MYRDDLIDSKRNGYNKSIDDNSFNYYHQYYCYKYSYRDALVAHYY